MKQKNKYCYIDMEFNDTKEEILNLVCCSFDQGLGVEPTWLQGSPFNKSVLIDHLEKLNNEGYIFVSFGVEAEASSFYSLGLDPSEFKWICLFLEYRNLLNNHYGLSYGKQLIDGKIKTTYPPEDKYGMTEKEKIKAAFDKPKENMAAAAYKLLGVLVDTERKTLMRDIIIRSDVKEIEANRKEISDYCDSDVEHLEGMLFAIQIIYHERVPFLRVDQLREEMLKRGRYAALSAKQVRRGYPVNVKQLSSLVTNIPLIIAECCYDINKQFPDNKPFRYVPKDSRYSVNTKVIKKWIKDTQDVDSWVKTDSDDLSLSMEAFTKFFHFRHDFPRDNYGAQILRYLKLKQSLFGFIPSPDPKKKTIFDFLGSDGRVRPYMNIYRSQSARTQPSSTSFIPLKSAWMRSLIEPPPGKAIGSIDYKSQEFLLKGLISGDTAMMDAYDSGDVYLFFAKAIGLVPTDGMRADYEDIRNQCKSTVLGISYLMSKYGLSKKLTNDTGVEYDEADAQETIDDFNEAFPDQFEWNEDIVAQYEDDEFIRLGDGWYMWGDNTNFRSVTNIPIQGAGSVILREAVHIAEFKYSLRVLYTLHDAIYIEFDSDDSNAMDKLDKAMKEAFTLYFKGHEFEDRAVVKTDLNIWSQDYPEEESYVLTFSGISMKRQKVYIDERSAVEYKNYSPYFQRDDTLELL